MNKWTPLFVFSMTIYFSGQIPSHIVDHQYKGCPTNAGCTQKLGGQRSRWMQQLKNKSTWKSLNRWVAQNGLPMKTWTRQGKHLESIIFWDSRCPQHQKAKPIIHPAEVFIRNFKHLPHFAAQSQAYLLRTGPKKETIVSYPIPRDESPLFINQSKLVFTMQEEGIYYGLSVSRNGELTIHEPKVPKNGPLKTACPEVLKEKFKAHNLNHGFYSYGVCKKLWNQQRKRYETIVFGWSC